MVIDPAVRRPELRAFNHLTQLTQLPLTYHLPGMHGFESFEDDATNVAGIVIFGSASSVHARLSWQVELERYLKGQIARKTPILGFCYGHQMLAYMFGGTVQYHTPTHEKLSGFRKVKLSADRLWNGKEISGELNVSHNEIVSTCPSEMKIIGTSDVVAIEALAHRTLPIWSFQAHPEAVPGQFAPDGNPLKKFEFGYSLVKHFFDYVKEHVK